MATEVQELPEQGEIVLATITKIMDHGAYVSLDEYGGKQGFLHISEIAPGWIRSVGRFVKEGEKKVLLVKKVRAERSDIDLSLKQVSNDQRKKKLLEVKRFEKGQTLIQNIKEKAKLSETERYFYSKISRIQRLPTFRPAALRMVRNARAVFPCFPITLPISDCATRNSITVVLSL